MKIVMVGLGSMGSSMARRLCRSGIEVVGYDNDKAVVKSLTLEEGLSKSSSLVGALKKCPDKKIVWLMLPHGDVTEKMVKNLANRLSNGDLVIDGGNSDYHDSQRRGAFLAQLGVGFIDAGISGGVQGLDKGYCTMVGGERANVKFIRPVLEALSPDDKKAWAHVGPSGAGHFTKMVHNGIACGMMQVMVEGFTLLRGKKNFNFDLAQISQLWAEGSLVCGWLMDNIGDTLGEDENLDMVMSYVADAGEGGRTIVESVNQGVAVPVMTQALQLRFKRLDKNNFSDRMISAMSNSFDALTDKSDS